jgi:hypothetical protein
MTEPRLIFDMLNSDYHSPEMKSRSISKSGLDQIAKSPAHFQWFLSNPTEETPALVFGRAFHTMILEPEKADEEIVILPDSWMTKKECGISIEDQKENFRLQHRGKAFLTADMAEMARGMTKSVEEHAAARVVLRKDQGKAEVTALWTDVDTGVDCRARFDWLREDGLIVDLKTTRCAKPEVFEKLALEHRYHVQAAFYMEAYRRVTGQEPAGFAFVAVEKEPPYCACVYVSQPDFLQLGRKEYLQNLTTYAECLKTNDWPGYEEMSLVKLDLPAYAVKRLNAA